MQDKDNSLMATANVLYPDPVVGELLEMADKINVSERLVDMNQVIELTTLSRRTLLNLEARGEFPVRVQVTEGRKAWYLSEVIEWINNIPRTSETCQVPVPAKPDASLCLKTERVRQQARGGKSTLIG
ncbi:AlpA family transcriptional regulator [Salmonella enterica subsp. enterica]|nr:AlpA family phage regulatory protein [Salmonella enterica]ECI4110131.1 AlpA family transcriptional regulator [Salmonella enterica subsp. enterica]EAW0635082.1 AlpA family phage regulatory protein [Salmonella enterica]EBA3096659.1 AlpA family phage regulatory protein [Salmonella enterica]EBP1705220.1 AlpA family phage regulatory protein [Salmonella enterica]